MLKLSPFHLAIPVNNLEKNRTFYRDVLGCEEGRSSDHWVDFNFFGHQLVIHFDENIKELKVNPVDGKNVPIPHFGIVLEWDTFKNFSEKLKNKNRNKQSFCAITIMWLPGRASTTPFCTIIDKKLVTDPHFAPSLRYRCNSLKRR